MWNPGQSDERAPEAPMRACAWTTSRSASPGFQALDAPARRRSLRAASAPAGPGQHAGQFLEARIGIDLSAETVSLGLNQVLLVVPQKRRCGVEIGEMPGQFPKVVARAAVFEPDVLRHFSFKVPGRPGIAQFYGSGSGRDAGARRYPLARPTEVDGPLHVQIFNIPMAQIESMIQSDRVADDVGWKTVALAYVHAGSIRSHQLIWQYSRRQRPGRCGAGLAMT